MAKHNYVLVGPEAGASGLPVTKDLVRFEGDAVRIEDGFVVIVDNEAQGLKRSVIRLAEGQAIKQVE